MPNTSNEHSEQRCRPSIRERIADAVDISKDIILDTVLIRMTGTHEIILENYKGILEYSDKRIRVKTNPKIVNISGSLLEIRTITDELLIIAGGISGITFTED